MSIKQELNNVIKNINSFSNHSSMVAINTTIEASKLDSVEGAAFKVLASEIQHMSKQSLKKLDELDNLIIEITELSILINKTGSLRMLLMKMITAKLMDNLNLLKDTTTFFNAQFEYISKSEINKVVNLPFINIINDALVIFQKSIHTKDSLNDVTELIAKINKLIGEYEKYAG